MNRLTVTPFLVAFFAAVAAMPTNIYQVCAWNVGTLDTEPWRTRTNGALSAVLTAFSWLTRLWTGRTLRLSAALALALLAAHVAGDADLLAIGVAGTVAEPTLSDVKDAIEKQNRAYEEFKRTNDTRLKQLEERGGVDPTITAKLEKLEKDLVDSAKVTDAFAALEAKVNRLKLAGVSDEEKGLQVEHKAFNLELKSHAQASGRPLPADVSIEDYKAYKEQFALYLRRGPDAVDRRAMSVGSDPDGGYLVTPDVSGRIVKRIYETSPMRPICAVATTSSDKYEGLRDLDEASGGGWVGEKASRSETTTPEFARWSIPIHEQYENPGVTQKLIDDAAVNVEEWLSGKVADKMVRRENTSFVTGNGVAQPRGFASYTTAATADSSRTWGELEHVLTGTNGGWGTAPNGSDKLIDLVHKLKSHFRQSARWAMNRVTLGSARQLKANSEYIWLPSMMAGQPSTLLGFPITELEDMATYTTTGALAVALGDFQMGYQIVDRIGIRVLRDPYTNKPYILFYTTKRVGGDVIDFEAIKFLKFAA